VFHSHGQLLWIDLISGKLIGKSASAYAFGSAIVHRLNDNTIVLYDSENASIVEYDGVTGGTLKTHSVGKLQTLISNRHIAHSPDGEYLGLFARTEAGGEIAVIATRTGNIEAETQNGARLVWPRKLPDVAVAVGNRLESLWLAKDTFIKLAGQPAVIDERVFGARHADGAREASDNSRRVEQRVCRGNSHGS
jgi:hypothetical protein